MKKNPLLQAIGDIVRLELVQQGGMIRLKEEDPANTCGPIALSKQGIAVVLKLDKPDKDPSRSCQRPDCPNKLSVNDRLFPLFQTGVEELTRVCDYIIFYQDRDGEAQSAPPIYVFLCELKSGTGRGLPSRSRTGGCWQTTSLQWLCITRASALFRHFFIVA